MSYITHIIVLISAIENNSFYGNLALYWNQVCKYSLNQGATHHVSG